MDKELLQKAYDLLARRDHAVRELREKLKRKGAEPNEIEEVIEYLKGRSYLNDAAFAHKYTAYRLRTKPSGHLKIRCELAKKGIKKVDIDAVLAADECAELPLAKDLLSKKSKSFASLEPLQRRNKLFAYLKNRGFRPETIYKVLERC